MIGLDSLINGFCVIRFGQVRRDDINADIGFVSIAIRLIKKGESPYLKTRSFKIPLKHAL